MSAPATTLCLQLVILAKALAPLHDRARCRAGRGMCVFIFCALVIWSIFCVSEYAPEAAGRRESVPAPAARVLSRAQRQAPACRQSDSPDASGVESLVQLARRTDCREPEDLITWHRKGFGLPLALKSEAGRWSGAARLRRYGLGSGAVSGKSKQPIVSNRRCVCGPLSSIAE